MNLVKSSWRYSFDFYIGFGDSIELKLSVLWIEPQGARWSPCKNVNLLRPGDEI